MERGKLCVLFTGSHFRAVGKCRRITIRWSGLEEVFSSIVLAPSSPLTFTVVPLERSVGAVVQTLSIGVQDRAAIKLLVQ